MPPRDNEPWYQAEWLMWTAIAALVLSLAASWLGWKVAGSELHLGSVLRVYAGLIAVGRTIAKREQEGRA